MGLEMRIVQIGADEAHDLLGRNTNNRPMKHNAVERYAQDMLLGRWLMAGEPIKVGWDGVLLDGQNRLAAVLKVCEERPGFTVPMVLVEGLEPESQDVMDTGVGRSAADQLIRGGAGYASCIAATTRLVLQFDSENGLLGPRLGASNIEVIQFARAHPELEEQAHRAYQLRAMEGLSFPSVFAAALHIIERAGSDEAVVEEFFRQVSTGANLAEDSPALAYRNRMTSARAGRETVRNTQSLDMMLRAWNAWRGGEPMRRMVVRPLGKGVGGVSKVLP